MLHRKEPRLGLAVCTPGGIYFRSSGALELGLVGVIQNEKNADGRVLMHALSEPIGLLSDAAHRRRPRHLPQLRRAARNIGAISSHCRTLFCGSRRTDDRLLESIQQAAMRRSADAAARYRSTCRATASTSAETARPRSS